MARDYGSEREVCQSVGGGGGRRLTNDWRAISRPTRRLQRHDSIRVGHGQIITRDVSCTSFDVHEDDSYTGRARVAASAGRVCGTATGHAARLPDNDTIRYDTRCYFNVRSKTDISQLNLPHGTDN